MGSILRVVRGRVADASIEGLRAAATGARDATAGSTPGLRRFHLATRPAADADNELVILTCWDSVDDALRAYDGNLDAVMTLGDISAHAELVTVAYFELDEVHEQGSAADAAFLRLTVGRVARGADAEIQQELRARLGELGPLTTEAYVARRIVGDQVEVAFMSTWSREDPARPLDGSFWPDIAARYDAFEVAVYGLLASGPSGR